MQFQIHALLQLEPEEDALLLYIKIKPITTTPPQKRKGIIMSSGVYKDVKHGTWFICRKVKGSDGIFHSITKRGFAREKDALNAMFAFTEEKKRTVGGNRSSENFSLCIESWMAYDKTRKASHTFDNDVGVCRHYLVPEFANMKISAALSKDHVSSFRERVSCLTYTTKTKRKIISTLKQIVDYSVSMAYVPGNLARLIAPLLEPFPKTGNDVKHPKRALTKDEYRAFMATFGDNDKYRILFEFFFYTGVRCSELRGLQWDCVDFNEKKIYVHQQLQYSRENHVDELLPTKTEKSVRWLDLGRNQKLIDDLYSLSLVYKGNETDFLFFKKPITKNPIVFQIRKHCRMAGIRSFSPHEIRHTVASWLVAGCKTMSDLIVVQRWLGHASLKETLDTYSHYLPASGASPLDSLSMQL